MFDNQKSIALNKLKLQNKRNLQKKKNNVKINLNGDKTMKRKGILYLKMLKKIYRKIELFKEKN